MKEKTDMRLLLMISFVAALGGILFRFDTAVISGTISFVKTQIMMGAVS